MSTTAPITPCPRILVVDDDVGVRSLIANYLERHGCMTALAGDAHGMRQQLATTRFDLVVLDLMLPAEDGLSALRRLRRENASPPVIMLSAVGSEIDRIIGLEVGADDYLAKPCNPRELLVRIQTVLKRATRQRPAVGDTRGATSTLLRFAGWRMDPAIKELRDPADRSVYLTDGEFALLRALAENPHRVLTRDQLLDLAHGEDCDLFDRAIDVQVSRLRRKLAPDEIIRTVRNEGYMFLSVPTRS